MKKFIMLILGYIVSHAVYAQVATSIFENDGDAFSMTAENMPQLDTEKKFTYGVRTGLNISGYQGFGRPNAKLGLLIGTVADYSVSDVFSIEYGLLFVQQGTGWAVVSLANTKDGTERTERINYLRIPVNARCILGNKIFMYAGYYLGFAVGSGKGKITFNNYDGSKEVSEFSLRRRFFDWGLNIGAAIKFGNNIQAGLEWNQGMLNNGRRVNNITEIQNCAFALTATYMFGKRKNNFDNNFNNNN